MSEIEKVGCSCCSAPAKYEVNESFACGRHVAYLVETHCTLSACSVTVRKIDE